MVFRVSAISVLNENGMSVKCFVSQETMKSLRPGFPYEIRLSSAGLVYHHFGERILADQMKRPVEDKETQIVYDRIYEGFIMEIDAIDNGVSICEGDTR